MCEQIEDAAENAAESTTFMDYVIIRTAAEKVDEDDKISESIRDCDIDLGPGQGVVEYLKSLSKSILKRI
jgi:hypothetical protein